MKNMQNFFLKNHTWWFYVGVRLLRKFTNSVREEQCRLIMDNIVSSTDGNVEISCDVTNVSASISLDYSANIRKQFLCHNYVRLNGPWKIRCLLSVIAKHSRPPCHPELLYTHLTVHNQNFAMNIHRLTPVQC